MQLLALALAPGFVIILFILWRDQHDREPVKLLFISFLLGILAAPVAIGIDWVVSKLFAAQFVYNSAFYMLFKAFILAGLVEEFSKFIMVRGYAYRKAAFNEPLDGIVYSVMVAVGFASIENVLYVYGSPNGFATGLMRMFTAVPGHAMWGLIMGYYIGLAKFKPGQGLQLILTGYILAVVFHGGYDALLFITESNEFSNWQYNALFAVGAFGSLLVSLRVSHKALKKHRQLSRQLFVVDKRAEEYVAKQSEDPGNV